MLDPDHGVEPERDQSFSGDHRDRHADVHVPGHQRHRQNYVQHSGREHEGVDQTVQAQRQHPLHREDVARHDQRRQAGQDSEDHDRRLETWPEDHANQKRGAKEDQDAYGAGGAAHHEEARPGQPGRLAASMHGEVTGPREDGLGDRAEQGGEVLADAFGAHVIANHG